MTGYAPVRLCSITHELVRGEPIELSDEVLEDPATPCSWNIVFDMPIPGWLPVTSTYGDIDFEETGTRYALYATATYLYSEDNCSTFSLSRLFSFGLRSYSTNAPKCPVVLQRVVEPPAALSNEFPLTIFVVETQPESGDAQQDFQSSAGPPEVFAGVQVIASVPAAIPINETSLPFVLRLRVKDLMGCERERLRVTGFSVDIEQFEVYRSAVAVSPREKSSDAFWVGMQRTKLTSIAFLFLLKNGSHLTSHCAILTLFTHCGVPAPL